MLIIVKSKSSYRITKFLNSECTNECIGFTILIMIMIKLSFASKKTWTSNTKFFTVFLTKIKQYKKYMVSVFL